MNSKTLGKLIVVYHPEDQDAVDVVGSACDRAIKLAEHDWGLPAPENCRIFIMTSWWEFVFQSAPWPYRMLLFQSIPFWGWRIRRTWPYVGGWTQRYGRMVTIGIKPPRLLEGSDTSIGARIFVEEKDLNVKVQHITCHELVHACSAHLKLPPWLNEGIAMLTVDHFLNKPSIKRETLELLKRNFSKSTPPAYRQLSRMNGESIAYHSVRGYWVVRYLEEKIPGFICRVLSLRLNARRIEHEIAAAFEMEPKIFWSKIDQLVVDHFESQVN